jgi:hypothetical protein
MDDAHWTVEQPNGITQAKTVYPGCENWWGGWMANGPNSTWIGRNTGQVQGPAGYSFHRVFDLSGYNLSSVSIHGFWNIDDAGSLKINGIEIARLPWCLDLSRLHSFTVPTQYLNQGSNTLTITMDACNEWIDAVRLEAVVQVQGACCYGQVPQDCSVTDQATCEQQLSGTWHGPGTDCADSQGNGVADVCEPPDEACCLPTGSCTILNAAACLAQGGSPRGPGSKCSADSDKDGISDACDQCPGTVPGAMIDAAGCPPFFRYDFDRDGDVDGADLTVFIHCATGPGIAGPPPGCAQDAFTRCDAEGDQDVDQEDFGFFQRCHSGPDKPAELGCVGSS